MDPSATTHLMESDEARRNYEFVERDAALGEGINGFAPQVPSAFCFLPISLRFTESASLD